MKCLLIFLFKRLSLHEIIMIRYILSFLLSYTLFNKRSASSLAYSLSDLSASDVGEANPRPVVSDRENLERCILLVANHRPRRAIVPLMPVSIHLPLSGGHWSTYGRYISQRNPEARRLPNYNGERTAFLQAVVHGHAEVGAGVYICIRIVL